MGYGPVPEAKYNALNAWPHRSLHLTCICCFVLLVFAATAFAQQPATKSILNIAGKDVAGVEAVLGKPTSVDRTKYGPKCTYVSEKSGVQWEVVFIKGRADWITITPGDARPVPFDENAITAIGLAKERPTSSSRNELRWDHVQGLRSVVFHVKGSRVWYCYVRVKTP